MELTRCAIVFWSMTCAAAIVGPAGNATKSMKTDTYLDAYSKSRVEAEKAKQQTVTIVTAKDGEKKISNRDDSYNSGYDYSPPSDSFSTGYPSGPSSNSYLPPSSYNTVKFGSETTYNAPSNSYGPPVGTYGPPAQTYGPPAQAYGPPSQSYGPPAHSYGPPVLNYGPPSNFYGPPNQKPLPPLPIYGPPIRPSYGIPYSNPVLGFFEKFKLKLNILTIAKLLLKLLIFKKIVTMIAVVCMLLVIPKLIEFKKDDNGSGLTGNDEYERKFGKKNVVALTSVHDLVNRAISVYGQQQDECGVTCRIARVVDDLYEFEPYARTETATSQ